MEGLDLRTMLTVGGMLVSVVSAAVIVQTKLKGVIEQLQDIEQRLRALDSCTDKMHITNEVMSQRLGVLSSLLDPKVMESRARETASILKDIEYMRKKLCS